VEKVVKLCEPIVSLLRLVDSGGDRPAVGKVYFRMFEIVQNVDRMPDLSEDDRETVKGFVNNRWKMLHTDMHSAGFVLDPEYNFDVYSQSSNEEVMSGFATYSKSFTRTMWTSSHWPCNNLLSFVAQLEFLVEKWWNLLPSQCLHTHGGQTSADVYLNYR